MLTEPELFMNTLWPAAGAFTDRLLTAVVSGEVCVPIEPVVELSSTLPALIVLPTELLIFPDAASLKLLPAEDVPTFTAPVFAIATLPDPPVLASRLAAETFKLVALEPMFPVPDDSVRLGADTSPCD